MARRDPRAARFAGLWTASWLAVLLLAGLIRLGDLSVQWPVLLVPLLWALVAVRPRRGRRSAWERVESTERTGPRTGPRTDTVERAAVLRDGADGWS
jgi:hypothetical protein